MFALTSNRNGTRDRSRTHKIIITAKILVDLSKYKILSNVATFEIFETIVENSMVLQNFKEYKKGLYL